MGLDEYKKEADWYNKFRANNYSGNIEDLKINVKRHLRSANYVFNEGGTERGHNLKDGYQLLGINNLRRKNILDVACGTGIDGVFFALKGAKVWGIDISEAGMEIAKKRAEINGVLDECNFEIMSATNLNYESEKFDLIFGNACLHHIHKYSFVNEELYRVLKNGGKAVFINEPLGQNPFIEIFRIIIRFKENRLRGAETTLSYKDINTFGKYFQSIEVYERSFFLCLGDFFEGNININ